MAPTPAPLGLRIASCSCRGNSAPNRLYMCGCIHERAPKAAADAYARRGHRHRRAWRGCMGAVMTPGAAVLARSQAGFAPQVHM